MKKLVLLLFAVSLVFISCTDNTAEHEALLEAKQAIDKGGDINPGGGGTPQTSDSDDD
ncbi:exported hypothetical protein [Tenacibaculum litopenaei]